MGRFDTLDKRIDIIQKVVEKENDLNFDKSAKELVSILENESEMFIDSKILELGDSKDIIFYEQIGEYDEQKMIKTLTEAMDFSAYKEFEIIVFVHSIEEKFKVIDNVKPEIEKYIRKNKKSKKILEFSTSFVGQEEKQISSVAIDSAIKINKYSHKRTGAAGEVYNANLFDLVELYNVIGDSLFRDNVRKKIENMLEVDTEILKTLRENPDNFWFFNNGVTLMICKDCISQRREYQLDINVDEKAELSIINGAQTISIAAQYYYRLKNDIEKDKDNKELLEQVKNAKDTKVLLRVIKKGKAEENSDFYKDISVSLNRQKAINEADIRYTDYLIDDINALFESHPVAPYFSLDKREEKSVKKENGHYSIERFVKIAAIYLLQEPGTARAGKGKYIKQDTQWNRLKITEEEEITEDLFLKKYKPFIIVDKIFSKLSEKLSAENKVQTNLVLKNIYNYSAEFLTAYLVWYINGKTDGDFSEFPSQCDLSDDLKIEDLIHEYGKSAFTYFKKVKKLKEEEIESNLFKKDTVYKEMREYFDKNCEELHWSIEELF